ncbi:MAG: LysR family transcriptional regulator [Betaproteobacteria bacterium]|nr:LysR family transcriptional regulator [Betaproteobacteria bacterium]
MKHATLRQLKIFEAVARCLSFSRAAEELHLTQPAVSKQVKELETHVGLPLFEQLGKRIYLTAAGHEMLDFSRNIIQQFQEVEEAIDALKGVSGGRLNVAVISGGIYFIPRLLSEFCRAHPNVTVKLTVHNRQDVLRALAENTTDLAIIGRPPEGLDTVSEPFAPHPYVIVAPADHPLAGQRRIACARLAEERFIVREKGTDTRFAMDEAFHGFGIKPNIVMEIESLETIKQAVIAGMGIGFLPLFALGIELRVGQIVELNVEGFPVMRSWYVVHRRAKRLPPVAAAFKGFLLEQGAALIRKAIEPAKSGAVGKGRRKPGSR